VTSRLLSSVSVAMLLGLVMACSQPEPARQYVLQGQILEVHADRMSLTIRHEAIPGLMAAMTMTFPVTERRLLDGRAPGELVTATLEVQDASGRLVSITHVGTAPLPEPGTTAAGVLAVGDTVPDAAFVDQADRRRSFAEWTGTFTVLTFTNLRCNLADACGRIDRSFAALQRAIGGDAALAGRVRLVSIAVGSAGPGEGGLATFATSRGADPAVWTFLGGDPVTTQRFASRFGVRVPAAGDETSATSATSLLPERTALVAADGRLQAFYDGHDWTPAMILAAVKTASGPR